MKGGKSLFEVSLNREGVEESVDSRNYFTQLGYKREEWKEPNALTNFIFRGGSKVL